MLFQPPIAFPVRIDGRPMKAFVHEELDNPVQTVFKVSFSDGFVDEFIIEDDGKVYGSGIASIPYARSIRFDIAHLICLNPGRFYYVFQETIDGMPANIWVLESENGNDEIIFKVYYLEYFRFALKRNAGESVVSDIPRFGKTPDPALVKRQDFCWMHCWMIRPSIAGSKPPERDPPAFFSEKNVNWQVFFPLSITGCCIILLETKLEYGMHAC